MIKAGSLAIHDSPHQKIIRTCFEHAQVGATARSMHYTYQTEASRVLGPKIQPRIHKLPSRVFKQMWIHAVQGGEINTPYFKWFIGYF